jgi:membrane-associated protein
VEIAGSLIDFVLHVDAHLRQFVEQYGAWVYALLFLVVFVETGLVVMPFLPGDSMLFIVGALCGAGLMNYSLAVPLLIGPRVFHWEHSRLFNKHAFERAHAFYEEYGGITLVAARFLPFLRTFAPFVAGVAQMTRAKFTLYDVTGGTLWVVSIVTAGYLFGNLDWVQEHMSTIIWAMIVLPGLLAILGAWRARRAKGLSASTSAAQR